MRLLRRLAAYARVLRRAKRNRIDLVKHLVRRPALLGAVGAYEAAVMFSNRANVRVKYLACTRASSLVGCPY